MTAIALQQPLSATTGISRLTRQALEKLPNEYREPLLLQVIHGYSQKEIAEQLGISIGGAGTRLFRARAKFRELL